MNEVILIGGSHHNGLGLVRSFGHFGIKPYGIIIGEKAEKSFVRKSKYWKKTFALNSEKDLVPFLNSYFVGEKEPPVLIPWSDGAALELDSNYYNLSKNFILPSIKEKEGAIAKLQDKYEQINLARKYGLPMAKSWIININNEMGIPDDIVYPCIVKPVTSVEGNKLDITKANNSEDLMYILFNLKNKGYYRILCQEYIYFDYEFVFCGSCSSDSAFLISKNIRTWPIVGGTNSFFKAIADPQIEKVCMSILKALQDEGFKGLFDIEMFCSGDKILVNEFNWRNTGNSFFSHGTGVHYAVIWYYSMIGRKDLASNINHCCKDSEQYAMNEATDLRHVFFSGISFIEWLKDYKKTQSFALWYRGDLKPTFIQYMHLVKVLICGKKIN